MARRRFVLASWPGEKDALCASVLHDARGRASSFAGHPRFCLDEKRNPLGKKPDGSVYMFTGTEHAVTTEQVEQYGVWMAQKLGAEPARLATWSAWVDRMWP